MTFCHCKSISWIFLFFYKTRFFPFAQNFVNDLIKAAGKLRWMKLSRTAGDLVELGCCLAKAHQIGSNCWYRFKDNFLSRRKENYAIILRQLTDIINNVRDNNTSKITLVIEDKTPWVSDWYSPRSEIVRLYSLIIDKCTMCYWMNSDTYILHNELNWVTFLSNQSQTILETKFAIKLIS